MTEVLVAHCIDAEGPLGGDARRNADGTPEFLDNWPDILASLWELDGTRAPDSHGLPYRFNWFPLHFHGFATNPKERDTEPHAVYDALQTLPRISLDGIYFHHHAVPPSGIGDEWTDTWNPRPAVEQLERLLDERGHKPAVFRAGGTIMTNELSRWLEHRFLLDFSNRVSERSYPAAPLNKFNWHGAPDRWGSYQPSRDNFLVPGNMQRHIYRCIDLRSRYNELTDAHCDEAFGQARNEQRPAVLSFFSHDNRDMRPETRDVVVMLDRAADRWGMPWRSVTCEQAHERHHA